MRFPFSRFKVIVTFILMFMICAILVAQEKQQTPTMDMNLSYKKWTGDSDGMIQRRIIRVLVIHNKTTYFVDNGTQRGDAYDAMKEFETVLNKKDESGKAPRKCGVHSGITR